MLALAEQLNAPAWFSTRERDWPLVITHGVLLECGAVLGVDAIAGGLDLVNPSAGLMRALLWAALARAGADLTPEQVGDLIGGRRGSPIRSRLAIFRALLVRAWVWSMPLPEPSRATGRAPRQKPLTSLRAWAIARIELGVSDAEWLAMTPRQARALSDARLERMQREEILVGIIASASANFGACRPDPPLESTAFMIHPLETEEDDGPLTGEKILRGRRLYEKRKS